MKILDDYEKISLELRSSFEEFLSRNNKYYSIEEGSGDLIEVDEGAIIINGDIIDSTDLNSDIIYEILKEASNEGE